VTPQGIALKLRVKKAAISAVMITVVLIT